MPSARYLKYREKILAYAREHRAQVNANQQAYVKRHPERVKASKQTSAAVNKTKNHLKKQKLYQDNKEQFVQDMQAWRENHPEQAKASDKRKKERFYAKHPGRYRQWHKAWVKNHPAEWRALCARYRARKAGADLNDLTAQDWIDIQRHYGYLCVYFP